MKLVCELKEVREVKIVSETFKQRILWVQTQDQFPTVLEVQVNGDKADSFDLKVGDLVSLSIILKGRLWEKSTRGPVIFNNIICIDWELISSPTSGGIDPLPSPQPNDIPEQPSLFDSTEEDDLPF